MGEPVQPANLTFSHLCAAVIVSSPIQAEATGGGGYVRQVVAGSTQEVELSQRVALPP